MSTPEPPAGLSLKQRTLRGFLWTGLEGAARTLIQFGVLALIARRLSPEQFGIANAALVVVGISTIFSELGVGPAIVQRTQLEDGHRNGAFVISCGFGLLVGLVLWLLAGPLAAMLKMPDVAGPLRVLAWVFPATGAAVVSQSLLQREMRFGILTRVELVVVALGYGLPAVLLAHAGYGLWALIFAYLGQMILRSVLVFFCHPWRPGLRFSRTAFRDLLHFSGGMTIGRVANYAASNGDNLVVGRYLGADDLGIYGRAYQIMVAPAAMIGNVLEKVLFPAMVKVNHDDVLLGRAFVRGLSLLAVIMLPVSALIFVLAPEIIALMLGPQWTGVVVPLQIMSIALVARTSVKMSNCLMRARGVVYRWAVYYVIHALGIVLFAWVGQFWGLIGASLGVVLNIILFFLIMAAMSLRSVRLPLRTFASIYLAPLTLTALIFLGTHVTAACLRSAAQPTLAVLAAGCGSAALITAAAIGIFPATFLGPDAAALRDRSRQFLGRFCGSRT